METTNKFSDFWNSKWLFIPRVLLWIALMGVLPITFINQQFSLFKRTESGISFSGWALVAIIIAYIVSCTLINYIRKAFNYNFIIMVLDGLVKVIIPIVALILLCRIITSYPAQIEYILDRSLITCIIGIIINPLPKWSFEHKWKQIGEAMRK